MTRIQELRHRVALLRRRVVENEDGSFTEHWQEGDSVWASIVPCCVSKTSGETGEGWNRLAPAALKYKVTIRFRWGRFDRVRVSFWEGEERTLAMLHAPAVDPWRQWITCLMYELGEENE